MFRHKFLSMVLLVGMLVAQSVPQASAATLCDSAQFISDLSYPDGTSVAPGSAFVKRWRLANNGTCAWNTSYRVVWVGGDQMGSTSVNIPVDVSPGGMADISISLTAPATAGHYKSLWKLSNASGAQFGIGSTSNESFWVDINVVDTSAVIFDFVANAPYAQWKSGAGILPFPGTSGDNRGYSFQVNNPHLEDDSYDSPPGLLTVPQNKFNGYIQATYPEFQVQAGDKLQTLVNCEFGATGCYVTFRIDYLLPNGAQKTLWQWKEAYDKRFYRANLDLSSLAGQKVRFVFMLLSSGFASADRAIWGSPRIVRTGTVQPPAPPATLTPLPPLTATATPITPPPPTMQLAGCDRATFVSDVTVQDGTHFAPSAAFTKTWRLKNSGACTWTTAYKLLYYSGDQMSAPTMVNLPWGAVFNQTVDVSVNMIAPSTSGAYRGYWILANASGQLFGIGADASKPIWVDIEVTGEAPNVYYDFLTNVCSAQWKSGAGIIPCPGLDRDSRGYVLTLNPAKLEDGSATGMGLLTAPQNRYNGYLQGYYPAFTVQPGDRFQSGVSCEYGTNCYVTLRLDYMTPTGYIGTFWQTREQNDGRYYPVDVDLTPLAGRSIRFILTTLATGSASNDRAVWSAPRILRTAAEPPTITPAPPTDTPATVVPPPIVTSPDIRNLHMIDSNNGWALGDSYVLRTLDGGVTWYNVSPADVSDGITGEYVLNKDTAWIVTHYSEVGQGSLYRTSDGGSSWTRNDVPFRGGMLQFLDNNHGFVMSILDAAMNKQSVAIYQTTDGGRSWTMNYINDPTYPGAGTSLPLGGHKNGMIFRDVSRGWVGGGIPVSGFAYLYTTADSGFNWSLQPLSIPAEYADAPITTTAPVFFGPNDAALPVWMSAGIGQRDLYIFVTHDGGLTWTRSAAFARNAGTAELVSVRDAFSWNTGGFLQVTNDSGANWRQVTPNVNFGEVVRDMDFISTTVGWVLDVDDNGNTALYRTFDGGVTWTLLFGTTAPPPIQLLPDLVITSMHIELQNTNCFDPGDTMGVRVWVKNNGNSISPRFVLRVNGVDQTSSSFLGIGETTILFFPGYTNPVTAIIDPAGAIEESDETNNTRSEMVAVPTPPLPCVTPATFAQDVVNALNAKNFDLARSKMMGQSFMMAFWQSQGTSYPPDAAIEQVQSYMNANTVLTADPNRDLVALLGGSSPYEVMGLAPSTSLALFVSGWGADAKDEAILYVKQLANGNWYWYGLLVAPGGFARLTPTPITLQGPFAVARVAPNDVLNVRSGAGVSYPIIGWFPPDATHIMKTGATAIADGVEWAEIQKLDGGLGWVDSSYLTEYVTNESFCSDGRVLALIEQLKGSMIQSNGDMFASMIGPKQGIAINLWRGVPAVHYTNVTARSIFTDTTIYDWGTPPGAGGPGIQGTFAQIVQPHFVDVFNSNYQLGCDNPSYAAGMSSEPWPHTNIHFYSITKPPSADAFDWKVWLVGFEYIDGTPYLYGTLGYVWEP